MNKKLPIITLGAFVLGIVGGFIIPNFMLEIGFLGDIYVNLLKVMIVPVLFCGIVVALTDTNNKTTSKITIRTIILFIIMFCVSFLINCGLVALIQPGVGFHFTEVEWDSVMADIDLATFFTAIFPNNILMAAAENSILPVILFAFVFGIALSKIKNDYVIKCFDGLNKIFNLMLQWIMYITPIGVFALMGRTTAEYGPAVIKTAAAYIGCAWVGCLVIGILVMILPVWIYCKINPITYIKNVSEIWIITLSTCSSAATLPNTIRVCNEKFNIPSEITNIVVPLGCTIHMCGGAVSFSLLALFNAQMYGLPITPALFLVMLGTALLINMGAPGIPGGGIAIGASYLAILGIPLDFIGFYAGIYRLLDMPYTTMNVTGDITANCIIKKSLE